MIQLSSGVCTCSEESMWLSTNSHPVIIYDEDYVPTRKLSFPRHTTVAVLFSPLPTTFTAKINPPLLLWSLAKLIIFLSLSQIRPNPPDVNVNNFAANLPLKFIYVSTFKFVWGMEVSSKTSIGLFSIVT